MYCVFDGGLSIQEYSGVSQASSLPSDTHLPETEFIRGEGMGGGVGGMVYSIKDGGTENEDIICSHANHRGDIIARSNASGSLTSFALYEAYGTRPYEWGDDPDRQKANTKEEETDLNLLNEGMRWRDLETGTFLTRDPIGYADGPNVYCYVHCNPITHFDPLGLAEGVLNKIKEAVIGVLTIGPIDAVDAASGNTADTARSYGAEMADKHAEGMGAKPADVVNAVRHATWQALLTQQHGAKDAKTVGDLHELGEDKVRPADSAKDRHNNSVGRAIGEATKDPQEAKEMIEKHLLDGKLMIEDPENTEKGGGDSSSGSDDSSDGSSSGDSSDLEEDSSGSDDSSGGSSDSQEEESDAG